MKENLKVLMINGSPKANGNTAIALKEMENIFKENGNKVIQEKFYFLMDSLVDREIFTKEEQ